MDAADLWDPADFYYDDDPEEFEVEMEEQVQVMRGLCMFSVHAC